MKKLIFALVAILLPLGLMAQSSVSGVVVDGQGEPVIGCGVFVVNNTSNGVVTDNDGTFRITVPANAILQFSCIGFADQQVPVNGQTYLRVVMAESAESLSEVMVVAFGTTTREAFTGSAGVMDAANLQRTQLSNPAAALAGRVAGVQITSSTGNLGSSPSIYIRGVSSISSGTEPLIIVDGMPYDGDLNLINTNDIESMTVLKDAASNALYGARGANGVVMITTKKAQAGEFKVNVDAKLGVNQNGLPHYQTLDAQQFYETYYKMLYNYYSSENGGMSPAEAHTFANNMLSDAASGVGPGYMVYSVPRGEDFILTGGIMNPKATMGAFYNYGGQTFWLQADDWEKEGLQNGLRQEYNISTSGRTDKATVYASLGYLNQEGIQYGSSQERITGKLKAELQVKKWLKVGGNLNYTNYNLSQTSEGTIGSGTIWAAIKTRAPIYPVYFRDGNGRIMIDRWGKQMFDFAQQYNLSRAGGVGGNCIFNNLYDDSTTKGNAFIVNGFTDITLAEGLVFTVNANIYDYSRRHTYIDDPFEDYYTSSSNNGSVSKESSNTFTFNTQQLLNFNRKFGLHDVGVMAGHEYYKYTYQSLSASGYNFGIAGATELSQMLNLDGDPSSSSSGYNNEGFFIRALYNYDGKYYGSVSARRDASSRFAKEHRWGSFWSAGAAWIISKEDFFNVPGVDELKLKVSIGSQGNDNIGNYKFTDTYNIVNNDNSAAYQFRQKGFENITWETNTNINAGFEYGLFGNRLTGSLEYYYRKTSDMLFSLSTPPSVGYTSYFMNLGDMRNTGVELDLHANLVNHKEFRWDVDFNISYVDNKVLRLPDQIKSTTVEGYDGYVNADNSFVSKYQYFVAEGLPFYTWYLPQYAGTDKETGEALYYVNVTDEDGNPTGERTTTKDASKATDYLCGNALAPWYGGFGTSIYFHGFDFSVNMNYQLGGLAFDYTYQSLMHTGGTTATNWHVDILNAWTPANHESDIPRLYYTETYSQTARSDRFLTSASYLNIQNVNLGYTFPNALTQRIKIDKIRIYASIENLGFFTSRKGLDPRYDIGGFTNPELYSPIRTISGGIQLTF